MPSSVQSSILRDQVLMVRVLETISHSAKPKNDKEWGGIPIP